MERQDQLVKEISWPLKDILSGIGIFAIFILFAKLKLFSYKPWIFMPLYVSLFLLTFLSLILYALYICKRRGLWPLFDTVSPSKFTKELFISLGYLFLINIFIVIVMLIFKYIFKIEIDDETIWKSFNSAPSSISLIIILITSFTLGPIAEELFFRGFLYNALKSRIPIIAAAISQSLIFTIFHQYGLFNSIVIFLYGIAFAIVYEKRRNLLSPILVHALKNAFFAVPILILSIHNFHIPAKSWDDAMVPPAWLKSYPMRQIERQESGMEQLQYARDTWGSKGSRRWKIEANAFNAVLYYFPEDKTACARAKLGIVEIYTHFLKDYRRAVVEADELVKQYPEQRKQVALALSNQGWSYYMLRDFRNSREAFDMVINEFQEYEDSYESAQKGVEWLNAIEK